MNKLRNKYIQFLLNTKIPIDSEMNFCGSDDDMKNINVHIHFFYIIY